MAVPDSKEELLADIEISYQKLIAVLNTLPLDCLSDKSLEGHAKGTLMSVDQLIAYLVGWGQLVLKWHRLKNNGLEVDFPETGYKWNELGKLAQKFYTDYETYNSHQLHELLRDTVESIIVLVNGYSNQDLYQKEWYTKWTMGRMIQFNTSSPYRNATGRIRKWKKERSF